MSDKKTKDKFNKGKPIPSNMLETPKEHDLSHKRDLKCVPIAHELIKFLASMEVMPVGSHVNETETPMRSAYLPVVHDFLKLLIEKDVKITEVTYIFALAKQGLEFVSDTIDETMNQQMNRVTELTYGLNLNDSDQVTVKQLNTVVANKEKISEIWKPILEA